MANPIPPPLCIQNTTTRKGEIFILAFGFFASIRSRFLAPSNQRRRRRRWQEFKRDPQTDKKMEGKPRARVIIKSYQKRQPCVFSHLLAKIADYISRQETRGDRKRSKGGHTNVPNWKMIHIRIPVDNHKYEKFSNSISIRNKCLKATHLRIRRRACPRAPS